jgi:hypothetical protein
MQLLLSLLTFSYAAVAQRLASASKRKTCLNFHLPVLSDQTITEHTHTHAPTLARTPPPQTTGLVGLAKSAAPRKVRHLVHASLLLSLVWYVTTLGVGRSPQFPSRCGKCGTSKSTAQMALLSFRCSGGLAATCLQ